MTASAVLQLHPKDNVLVALNDLRKGEVISVSGRTYTPCLTDVPAKHKFATHDISPGGDVVMYGVLDCKIWSQSAWGGMANDSEHSSSGGPLPRKN